MVKDKWELEKLKREAQQKKEEEEKAKASAPIFYQQTQPTEQSDPRGTIAPNPYGVQVAYNQCKTQTDATNDLISTANSIKIPQRYTGPNLSGYTGHLQEGISGIESVRRAVNNAVDEHERAEKANEELVMSLTIGGLQEDYKAMFGDSLSDEQAGIILKGLQDEASKDKKEKEDVLKAVPDSKLALDRIVGTAAAFPLAVGDGLGKIVLDTYGGAVTLGGRLSGAFVDMYGSSAGIMGDIVSQFNSSTAAQFYKVRDGAYGVRDDVYKNTGEIVSQAGKMANMDSYKDGSTAARAARGAATWMDDKNDLMFQGVSGVTQFVGDAYIGRLFGGTAGMAGFRFVEQTGANTGRRLNEGDGKEHNFVNASNYGMSVAGVEALENYLGGKLMDIKGLTGAQRVGRVLLNTGINASDTFTRTGLRMLTSDDSRKEAFEKEGGWFSVGLSGGASLAGSIFGELVDVAKTNKEMAEKLTKIEQSSASAMDSELSAQWASQDVEYRKDLWYEMMDNEAYGFEDNTTMNRIKRPNADDIGGRGYGDTASLKYGLTGGETKVYLDDPQYIYWDSERQIDLVEVGSNGKVRYVVDGRDLDTMTEAQVRENLDHATNLLDGSAERGAKAFGVTVEEARQRGADVVVITDNKKTQVEFSTMDSVHRGDPGATKMVTAAYSARAGENEEIVLMQPNAYAGSTGILSTDEYFIMTSEHEGVSIGGHANSNTNSTTQRVTGNHDWDRAQAFEESMTQRNAIRKTFGTELRLTRSEAKVGYQPGTNGLMALVESVDDAGGNATQWIDDYKLYCKTDKRKAYVAFYDLAGFVNAHSTGINTGGKTVMEYFLDQNEIAANVSGKYTYKQQLDAQDMMKAIADSIK